MNPKQKSPAEIIQFVEGLKRQWVATIDAMLDPLMLVSPDYRVIKVNKAMAQFSGQDVKTILGQPCYKILANRDAPCKGCKIKETIRKNEPQRFNIRRIRDSVDFEVTSQPIHDEANQLEGLVHVYRDRTEANKFQKKLLQSEKLASIGLLAGGVAHEINNPLGGILIFSQMMLKEMSQDNPFYSDVKEIETAALRCKSIVERLLDFARSRSDDEMENRKPVVVTNCFKSALKFALVQENSRRITITERWNDQDAQIYGDTNSLIQVFLNLIQNAFHAMPNGGELIISSSIKQSNQVLWGVWEVTDTGDGISDKHIKRIFDPFFTTKDPGEGTGLGLSICYSICQELGGTIDVISRKSEGTTFYVRFPILPKS